MQITIKTDHPGYYSALEQYVEPLKRIMLGLKKEYRLRLPKSITLRPLRKYRFRKRKYLGGLTLGRAGRNHKGYWIALSMGQFGGYGISELGFKTLVEEAAHITEAIKTGDWTHGKLFKEMERKAKQYKQRR